MPHYLDAAEFTKLFRRRHVNRPSIAAKLHLISQQSVRRFHSFSRQDLEDAASAATLTALRKIHKFDVNRPGANAFSYYTSVIMRAIARELRNQANRRDRDKAVSFELMLQRQSSPAGVRD